MREADVEAYVGDLRADGPGARPPWPGRSWPSASLHRFLAEEGRTDARPRRPGRGAAGAGRAAQGADRARGRGADRRGRRATTRVARRDRAILEVLYGTGLRISELVGPAARRRRPRVGADPGVRQGVEGAGRAGRAGHAVAALVDWLGPGGRPALVPERWARRGDADAVFLNRRGGRLTRQGAWLVVKRWGSEVGLDERLTPHVLRHSCATHMLDHGADIRAVQELLGHASVSTTQVYTKVSTERLVAAYRAAHPRATAAGRPVSPTTHPGLTGRCSTATVGHPSAWRPCGPVPFA